MFQKLHECAKNYTHISDEKLAPEKHELEGFCELPRALHLGLFKSLLLFLWYLCDLPFQILQLSPNKLRSLIGVNLAVLIRLRQ